MDNVEHGGDFGFIVEHGGDFGFSSPLIKPVKVLLIFLRLLSPTFLVYGIKLLVFLCPLIAIISFAS